MKFSPWWEKIEKDCSPLGAPVTAPASLWHHRGFLLLWGGQSVSELGSAVTAVALPLLAVTTLRVSTFEVALLAAASSAALLVALQAGALVPRGQLNEGAELTATGEIDRVAGLGVGGALVAAVGAALAVGADALSWSPRR